MSVIILLLLIVGIIVLLSVGVLSANYLSHRTQAKLDDLREARQNNLTLRQVVRHQKESLVIARKALYTIRSDYAHNPILTANDALDVLNDRELSSPESTKELN